MENLTVGYIEDLLRKYPKGTRVEISCGVCHHSSGGGTDILKIRDYTNQTFGNIELELNSESDGHIKCTDNEKRFYEKEIERLKEELKEKDYEITEYKDFAKSLKGNIEHLDNIKEFYDKYMK